MAVMGEFPFSEDQSNNWICCIFSIQKTFVFIALLSGFVLQTVICATMVFGFPLATGMETINDNLGKYMDTVVRNAEPISKVSNRISLISLKAD